ncbi:MAG: phospholipase D-like domain-containing protein [Methanomassiliicoccaceae archaeon]|jgi:phosphatidylserine/phosphatidylglycerophosphate/cardiolipin synthase-like enzyme|nr:phospholipase D-like domain-containing protein [Methanomassiliicoccaceae archaeon]
MKGIATAVCVLALLLVPCVSDNASAAETEALWLYEVIPAGNFEAVTIYNAGNAKANLRNYYLDDGEGTVRFSEDIFIDPKCSLSIASNAPDAWFSGRTVRTYGSGVSAKSFILADNGDEVTLKRTSNNKVIDAFVYGNGDTKAEGWKGPAFAKIPAGKMAVRSSFFDTDTADDWKLSVAGRTDEKMGSSGTFSADVTPFVFPDSKGDPVFHALEKASREVVISMYVFDHREIISLLVALLNKGVSVKILLEGSPGGGVPDLEVRYMTALSEKGAEVHVLKNTSGYKRYDLLHNKYAVIDSETVVMTSENWRESSFGSNRGWGAVIDSKEYAEYMRNIFLTDFDIGKSDVSSFKETYPSASAIQMPIYKERGSEPYERFPAYVKAILSPDFSFEYLKRELMNASSRVYAEQMSIQYSWTDITSESPLSWSLTAADNGADVKILADVTFDNEYDSGNYLTVSLLNDTDGMNARTISGGDNFSLTHNKGVIIDDTVWVSSINWTNASFMNNREAAVKISSKEVADYFAGYFMKDWGEDADMILSVTVKGGTEGEAVIFDASSGSYPKGTLFAWDLDGDGVFERTGIKIAALLPEGTNSCMLAATDPDGNIYTYEFTVTVHKKDKENEFFEPYIKYAPIIAIILLLPAVSMIIRRKRRR